jgi:ribosomal protein S18 acetylase RimI-like enzyme
LAALDVEAMERATVAAVAPPEVLEIGGWLVPLDATTVGRAKSAVPLSHSPHVDVRPEILAAYAERGLPAALRIADTPALEDARNYLTDQGFHASKPTLVKVGDVARLAAFADGRVELMESPDEGFASVFLGEGFDPEDGAQRVRVLRRSPDAAFAAVREGSRTVAVGVASFGHGWGGIHGMRTALDQRGRGHAGAILAALGREMQTRGIARVQLQVEEPNPARSLYRKAGFTAAWRYQYWVR